MTKADKFIAFVGFEGRTRRLRADDILGRSDLASVRLRVFIPALELARRHPVYIVSLDDFLADPRLTRLGKLAGLVFRKMATGEVLERAHVLHFATQNLRDLFAEVRVLADLSDDFSATLKASRAEELADYQTGLLQACAIAVPCQALAERLAPAAPHGVQVVEDPFEGPQAAPRAPAGGRLRLCWFGNGMLLEQVTAALSTIADRLAGTDISVEAVTAKHAARAFSECGQAISARHPGFELRFTEWSRAATWKALAACDLALLPQDPSVPWGQVKSHNRLVETIRAGRLAIASPIPSYRELADYAWVGDDLGDGVAWALAHPEQALERVRAGQEHIARRFSPATVAGKWAAALGLAAAQAG